jgi:hypothetical protein
VSSIIDWGLLVFRSPCGSHCSLAHSPPNQDGVVVYRPTPSLSDIRCRKGCLLRTMEPIFSRGGISRLRKLARRLTFLSSQSARSGWFRCVIAGGPGHQTDRKKKESSRSQIHRRHEGSETLVDGKPITSSPGPIPPDGRRKSNGRTMAPGAWVVAT